MNTISREINLENKETWDFTSIVHELRTKYGLQKEIVSFTPSITIILLQLKIFCDSHQDYTISKSKQLEKSLMQEVSTRAKDKKDLPTVAQLVERLKNIANSQP